MGSIFSCPGSDSKKLVTNSVSGGGICYSGIGIDSIGSIDTSIRSRLFPAPTETKLEIEKLGKHQDFILNFVTSVNGNKINILEATPQARTVNIINSTANDSFNNASNKVIIYSHGNAEDVYCSSSFVKGMADEFNIPVFIYDYVGYGLSEGTPSEEGCYDALITVVNYVQNKYPRKNIMLIGRSLGTGVVVDFISKTKWSNPVLLISSYKSIPRVLKDLPLEWLLKHNTFNNMSKMDSVVCPIQFIHGKNDELISFQHSLDLFAKLKDKRFEPIIINNATHNIIPEEIVRRTINKVLKSF